LEILPVSADYLQSVVLPSPSRKPARKIVYFPGSTIGNFDPDEAMQFLRRIANVCRGGGGLLIGVDLKKDREVLEAAYNDSAGVTAEFNLNLLQRINRELGADFDLDQWRHLAIYNSNAGRIEMHLISETDQLVHLNEHKFHFRRAEKISTRHVNLRRSVPKPDSTLFECGPMTRVCLASSTLSWHQGSACLALADRVDNASPMHALR